jgi:1,4-alpha-glucan branching enzyme
MRKGGPGPPSTSSRAAEKRAVLAERKVNLKSSQPIQPISERFPALEEQQVVLTFCAPKAKLVQVAGTFNGWRPETNPLEHTESGEWAARLMLKSGQYEYRFVVDGEWSDDPQATQSTANPHGGLNSILKVGLDDRADLL